MYSWKPFFAFVLYVDSRKNCIMKSVIKMYNIFLLIICIMYTDCNYVVWHCALWKWNFFVNKSGIVEELNFKLCKRTYYFTCFNMKNIINNRYCIYGDNYGIYGIHKYVASQCRRFFVLHSYKMFRCNN